VSLPEEPVSPQNVLSSVTDQTTVEWQRAWIQELKQKLRQRLVARRIRQEITSAPARYGNRTDGPPAGTRSFGFKPRPRSRSTVTWFARKAGIPPRVSLRNPQIY
jgi:hypothetical protein